jgi:hypothetical protein
MQPLKLTIEGEYWDSQIYAGSLFLFTRDGCLRTVDWDEIIAHLNIPPELRVAMNCAFLRSDYLYGAQWDLLFQDAEIKSLVQSKFERLAAQELVIPEQLVGEYTLTCEKSPFPFPHADTTMYWSILYAGSGSGVYRATSYGKKEGGTFSRAEKIWDCPTLCVTASYNRLALAAGDDGLFEKEIGGYDEPWLDREPRLIASENCVAANWVYWSIYASSHVGDGFLADFKINRADTPDSSSGAEKSGSRELMSVIGARNIFGQPGYSWGTKDKICQAWDKGVTVVGYYPRREREEERLRSLGTIELLPWKGRVVSGGTALFGTIIECENAVVVIPSEGEPLTLPGEPVNWRVFPRSKHYENLLHIIYDDRMEILSFNHDYFVNQRKKRSGIRFTDGSRWRGRYA